MKGTNGNSSMKKAKPEQKPTKKPLNVALGKRISQARSDAGHTQEWLAESVGVSLQYISDLERGVVGTSIPTLIKICDALNVSSDSLLFEPKEHPDLTLLLDKMSSFSQDDIQRLNRILDLAQLVIRCQEINNSIEQN